ncbi:MAG: M28 family peptidase, partial [Eubacteriales bacterium]|nr:M28 family peptidase [Eubacteriales bacterium]
LIARDVYAEYPDINMYKRLYEYGAAAAIYTTNDGHWDVPYVYANFETMDEPYTIPTAVIHYRIALELLQNNVETVSMNIQYEVEMGKTRTTIGVVEGTSKKDENIICCAHLDSAVSSTGASDDVAGVAMVMELAKYFNDRKNEGKGLDKTIRFIAWSGHECGLHGSKYYLMNHPDVYNSIKFVLNYDIVGNTISNYQVLGGFSSSVEQQINEIVGGLDLEWPVITAPLVCDTLNFTAKQIPHFTLSAGIFCGNHTKYDSLDLISPAGFNHPLQFSQAILKWAASDAEIEQGYDEALYEGMKATGAMYGWGLFDYEEKKNGDK